MRILIFYLNFTIKIPRKTSIIAVRMIGDPNQRPPSLTLLG